MMPQAGSGDAARSRLPYVHEWFRETARQRPSATAIEFGEAAISYAELAARASALAHCLRRAGAAPNEPVAMALRNPIDLIAATIGILDAGCGFMAMPLDFPDARLDVMMTDAAPRLAIADAEGAQRLQACGERTGCVVRVVAADAQAIEGVEDVDVPDDPDALAYIVFTSGSTGRPKGIAGRLMAIDHFVRWEIETFGLQPGIRVSQLASPVFDVFLRDIFVPLCVGGTVCIPPSAQTLLDGQSLVDWIESQDINLIHCVPSVFRLALERLESSTQFSSLRHVFLAGEPVLPADVNKWTSIIGDRVQLVNLYGPSETTMTKFCHMISAADARRSTVPIGRPMSGAAAMLLDEHKNPCSPGTIGEIYIRTAFRTLGYYGRPELTREVFVPNPFSADPNDLIYRTGDLARMLPDGTFEFIGRRDHQVKIRGVRVELSEIENVIREAAGVSDVAVVDHEDGHGSRYLAAYLVLADGGALSALQHHLASHLPEYLLPSRYVTLAALPRTANGKLDRNALPQAAGAATGKQSAEPHTPVQELVAGVWAKVLNQPRIGLHDNFFEIGGHSLLATRVIARLRRAFDIDMPLRALFRAPTVAGLARVIERARLERSGSDVPSIGRADRRTALPLSYGQQRLWFLEQLNPGSALNHVTCSRRLVGELDVHALRRAVQEIVRRHEVLRTTFPAPNGEPVQQVHADIDLSLPLVDLQVFDASSQSSVARQIATAVIRRPFDLTAGPLIRTTLIRLRPQEHVLTVVMHHSVSDGWSVGILVNELAALFDAYREGRPSPLPGLALQYGDYAVWEREWLQGERLEQQLAYWRRSLDKVATLDLPTDHARSPAATHPAGRIQFALPADVARELRSLARREGVTLFMLLLAGFQVVLSRWSGQRDVTVGTDVANREHLDVEGTIGFFVNQLVLRTDLGGDPTFTDLLGRVCQVTLGAYAHQQLPFDKLVEELDPARDVSRHPFFQTVFALRNEVVETMRLGELELQDFPVVPAQLSTELTLVMGEHGDTIVGVLLYASDLFGEHTARRLTDHVTSVLTHAAAHPESRLSELPLGVTDEIVRTTAEGNTTEPAMAAHDTVCAAVERYAVATPQAVAVACGSRELTYAQLNRDANQLAHHLRAHGVTSEALVAVCLPRGIDLLVSFIATLKAGAAYLPINPAYPIEHIRGLVRRAGPTALIAAEDIAAAIAGDVARISLAADRARIEGHPATSPARFDHPRSLAYVIYTSGSTGEPKGVMLEHRGLWNHLRAKVEDLGLTAEDVIAQNASSSFDISIWQLLAPLVVGGTVRVVEDEVATDGRALIDEVAQSNVSILEIVPALLEALLDDLTRREMRPALSRLRFLLSTGEALPATVAARWQQLYPGIPLVNAYGPTECSDDVTHHRAGQGTSGFVPIGRPLRNTRLYVLDAAGAVAPAGVPGELYVGGAGVGRGYLSAPGVTAERFVPDPFGDPGERLFKTGDLTRWDADGQLEFFGRFDDQVKIHGFRVELGAVRAPLAAYPGVRQSIVCARSNPAGDKRLVAYIAPRRWSIFPTPGGYVLPDGSAIAEQNRNETRYLYERIFERQIYFQHGIELAEDACVFDVGANIGLFTSRISELAPKGQVYAFEPIRPIFDSLVTNSHVCQGRVRVFDYGLAERDHSATFTYYPGYSIMSGLAKYANASADVGILKQFLANEIDGGDAQAAEALAQADLLLAGRLSGTPIDARLRTLSDVIREEQVARIDLLKIDVQRAGLDVLRGIAPDDWERIDQVVMEIHDNVEDGGHVREIEALLASRGYDVAVEQEPLLQGTDLYNVYARRPAYIGRAGARPAARRLDEPVVVADLRAHLAQRSPEYMVPSAFVLLPELPLTQSGKVDRDALPEPPAARQREYREPTNELEELLCAVWEDVLQSGRVGITDDFFELGGHSLLATRVAARVRQLLRVDVPVRALFETQTVENLARFMVAHETQPGRTLAVARVVKRAKQLSADEREALLARASA